MLFWCAADPSAAAPDLPDTYLAVCSYKNKQTLGLTMSFMSCWPLIRVQSSTKLAAAEVDIGVMPLQLHDGV